MAKVVLALATSHAPQLVTTVEEWRMRVTADRSNARHYFQGNVLTYDELATLRAPEGIAELIEDERQRVHRARTQAALDVLADRFAAAKVDVAVIVGNDQNECFAAGNAPAFAIYRGAGFTAIPKTAEQIAALPPGIAPTASGYCPPGGATYAGHPELAEHLLGAVTLAGFDPAQCTDLPVGAQGTNSIQHAFGFVFRRIMRDVVPPTVPVFVNTHYPPNRPTPQRCLDFGAALARAIASWPSDARVALIASGGLSHYVIDETFDRDFLAAAERGDMSALAAIDESRLEAGTAELKNWFPVVAAMNALAIPMTLVDYVPCYRSDAGTGTGMGFVSWP